MENTMVGNKIAKARKRNNISQAQLAKQLFISPQAVGKWERGESIPDILTINRLAEILGVDLNYFSESSPSEAARIELPTGQTGSPSPEPVIKSGKERSWDMSRENLVDLDFSGMKNLLEQFGHSNIQRCVFVGSDMSGLVLKSNNVDSCDFSGSDISSSRIQGSNLANNKFKNCSLKETEFSRSFVEGCDFSGADFTGAEFKSGGFAHNAIVDVLWRRTSFADMHIAGLVFEGTLEECFFENCAFTKVTFQHATLINTFFKNDKRLNRVKFVDCKADKMTYAFLKNGKADLSGITLLEA